MSARGPTAKVLLALLCDRDRLANALSVAVESLSLTTAELESLRKAVVLISECPHERRTARDTAQHEKWAREIDGHIRRASGLIDELHSSLGSVLGDSSGGVMMSAVDSRLERVAKGLSKDNQEKIERLSAEAARSLSIAESTVAERDAAQKELATLKGRVLELEQEVEAGLRREATAAENLVAVQNDARTKVEAARRDLDALAVGAASKDGQIKRLIALVRKHEGARDELIAKSKKMESEKAAIQQALVQTSERIERLASITAQMEADKDAEIGRLRQMCREYEGRLLALQG